MHDINELTVVTDESYTDFVAGLQKEIGEPPAAGPHAAGGGGGENGSYPLPADGRKRRQPAHQQEAPGTGQDLSLVAFDSGDLIGRCVAALDERLRVDALRYEVRHGEQRPVAANVGFTTTGTTAHTGSASSQVRYDLLGELAGRTQLTRRTIAAIVRQVSPGTFAQYRRNPGQFITGSARLINDQLARLLAEQAEQRLAAQAP